VKSLQTQVVQVQAKIRRRISEGYDDDDDDEDDDASIHTSPVMLCYAICISNLPSLSPEPPSAAVLAQQSWYCEP